MAALVGAPLCDKSPKDAKEVNEDSINYLTNILSDHIGIIIPTTNSGYGIGKKDVFCTEESPLNPISIYGSTKVNAERFVMKRKNSISLRLATVFGMSPRMRVDLLVNYFVYKAIKEKKIEIFEGNFKRNYVHIEDVANAFLFCIDNFQRLKYNTITTGANGIRSAYGNAAANALAYGVSEQAYTIKSVAGDKYTYTPVVDPRTGKICKKQYIFRL